jgi:hypothetical protein
MRGNYLLVQTVPSDERVKLFWKHQTVEPSMSQIVVHVCYTSTIIARVCLKNVKVIHDLEQYLCTLIQADCRII